jgi:hypothetical protein
MINVSPVCPAISVAEEWSGETVKSSGAAAKVLPVETSVSLKYESVEPWYINAGIVTRSKNAMRNFGACRLVATIGDEDIKMCRGTNMSDRGPGRS